MKKTLWSGVLLATVLLLGVGWLVRPAYARTIVVDGADAGSEWNGTASATNPSTLGDATADMSAVYAVNNATDLFIRFDMHGATTNWSGGTLQLRITIDDGGTPTYHYIEVTGVGLSGDLYTDCPSNFDLFSCTPSDFAANTDMATGVIGGLGANELAIKFSALGVTNGFTGNITLDFTFSSPAGDSTVALTTTLPTPLDVTLVSFNAVSRGERVELAWQTDSERQIAGFNLLRSATGELSDAVILNESILFGEGSSVSGANYSFTDPAPIADGSYWLQVVNSDGTTEEYGPVRASAAPASTNQVFIPFVRR